jgi:hypothetical protein
MTPYRTATLVVAVVPHDGDGEWKLIGEGQVDFALRATYVRHFGLRQGDLGLATKNAGWSDRLLLPVMWPVLRWIVRGGEVLYWGGTEYQRRHGRRWQSFTRPDVLWPIYALPGDDEKLAPGSLGDADLRTMLHGLELTSSDRTARASVDVWADEGVVRRFAYLRENPPYPTTRIGIEFTGFGMELRWPFEPWEGG